jgi:hypothetical protein
VPERKLESGATLLCLSPVNGAETKPQQHTTSHA